MDKLNNLNNTIKNLFEKIEEKDGAQDIVKIWDFIIDEKTKEKSYPVQIKKGVLFVAVSDSSTMYILNLKKRNLIEQINSNMKEKQIKNIRFKIQHIER